VNVTHVFAVGVLSAAVAVGQEKSVKPGVNDRFLKPHVPEFIEVFEGESREIFTKRMEILDACELKPGLVVADVGAGTGLFTRLFAKRVGSGGKVFAVEIAQEFLDHIVKTSKAAGFGNVHPILCDQFSSKLPENAVDVVFVCDTYHHFEFPSRTLPSLHAALKTGGRLVVVDFEKIPGKSRPWVLGHVRAGKAVVRQEIEAAGFEWTAERKLLAENYFLTFRKVEKPTPPKKLGPPLKAPK
jgi:predicted methyltransferase